MLGTTIYKQAGTLQLDVDAHTFTLLCRKWFSGI